MGVLHLERGGDPIPARGGVQVPRRRDEAEGAAGSEASARRRFPAAGRNRRVSLSSRDRRAREEPEGGSAEQAVSAPRGPRSTAETLSKEATGRRACAPGGAVSPSRRRRRRESRGGVQRDAGGRRVRSVSAAKAGAPRRPRCWAPGAPRRLLPEAAGTFKPGIRSAGTAWCKAEAR